MAPRALIVDDDATFTEAAQRLLERGGIDVVGAATTSRQALEQARLLKPDVVLLDIELGVESGFEVARQLVAATDLELRNIILISTHAAADLADLVAVSPALGFLPKADLSAGAIREFLDDRVHGHGCRHEALVYSSADELVAVSVPYVRHGLAADDAVLVVMREEGRTVLREALDGQGAQLIEYADARDWYRSTKHAYEGYSRYLDEKLSRGVKRIRIVAEALLPASPDDWKRYEASVSVGLAAMPVSFICVYDTRALPEEMLEIARETHPLLRSGEGLRPNSSYTAPAALTPA